MRVLCLIATAIGAYLSPLRRPRHEARPPTRRSARAARSAPDSRRPRAAAARARGCRGPPARPRTAARRRRAASHTDSMSTAIAPPASSSARRSPSARRETHTIVPLRTFRPRPVSAARSCRQRQRTATARSACPSSAAACTSLGDDHFARHRVARRGRRRSPARAAPPPGAPRSSAAAARGAVAGPSRSCAPRARARRWTDEQRPPRRSGAASSSLSRRRPLATPASARTGSPRRRLAERLSAHAPPRGR